MSNTGSALAGIGIGISLVDAIVAAANRAADIKEKKVQFAQRLTREINNKGYNVTVISESHRVRGYTGRDSYWFEGVTWRIYWAPKNRTMAVENLGHHGVEHWQNRGINWLRWGMVNHFHDHWDGGMGGWGEHRPSSDYPHREWLNGGEYVAKETY